MLTMLMTIMMTMLVKTMATTTTVMMLMVMLLVRNVLGTLNLGDILSQRETIAREMQVLPYIVILENVFVSSCILSSILRDNELIAIEWLLSLLQY